MHRLITQTSDDHYFYKFDMNYLKGVTELNFFKVFNTKLKQGEVFEFPAKEGLLSVNTQRMINEEGLLPPKILVNKVDGAFEYDEGRLMIKPHYRSVSFTPVMFYNGPAVFPSLFSYRVEGSDDTAWHRMDPNAKITLFGLPHGKYTLKVKANMPNNKLVSQMAFTILPAYYETTLFISLSIVVFLLVVVGINYWIWRMVGIRRKKENEFIHYQSATLKGQINSHMLFNVFQTVAHDIRYGYQEESYNTILSVADYMRQILNQADSFSHTLEKELDFCKNYLDFMSKIYTGLFKYEITSLTEHDVELVQIPSLIIQPFIENAIIHGFRNKEKHPYTLKLNYTYKMGFMIIQVEDDGMGLTELQGQKKFVSKGINLVRKKINSFYTQKLFGRKGGVKIHSKNNQYSNETGVMVSIFLPLKVD
ncbi:MAG: histidine kinase [Bacteroidetes bacterium]|nr:histidine kinase [Bacteroidota bacterium]